MGESSLFSMGPNSPFRSLGGVRALFSPMHSPSRIAHLENKSCSPTRTTSAEPRPRTETTARPLHPEILRRRSVEENPERMEHDARFRRRSMRTHAVYKARLPQFSPLGKQLRMRLLQFEEGANHVALVENTVENTRLLRESDEGAARGGVVEPHGPLSPGNDFTAWSPSTPTSPPRTLVFPAGNTSPVARRRLQLPPSLRVGSSEDGNRQGRSSPSRSVSWDSDVDEVCNSPERQQDAPPLRPRRYELRHDSPLASRLASSPHNAPRATSPEDDNARQRRRRLAMEKLATENRFFRLSSRQAVGR